MTDHLADAERHAAMASDWMERTADGVMFDPVRDHANLALVYAALELARRWPAPTDPAPPHDPETREEQDSA